MARPSKHDGVVYRRNDSNVWWMRYRDKTGRRRLESTNTTDWDEAQRQMREKIRGVSFCLMVATTLHSVAVGNLLPAWVKVVCVDINPSTVIKLSDRGSFQTVGLVTDVEPFLRALVQEIDAMEKKS